MVPYVKNRTSKEDANSERKSDVRIHGVSLKQSSITSESSNFWISRYFQKGVFWFRNIQLMG